MSRKELLFILIENTAISLFGSCILSLFLWSYPDCSFIGAAKVGVVLFVFFFVLSNFYSDYGITKSLNKTAIQVINAIGVILGVILLAGAYFVLGELLFL